MSELRLHRWLAGRLPELTSRLSEELQRQVPFYAGQPQAVLDGPLRQAIEANLRISLRVLQERRAFNAEERAEVIAWSALRAEQGVPLEAVLTAYLLAVELCWKALMEEARPDEAEELGALGLHLFGYLRSAAPAVTLAHVQRHGEQQEARRAMLEALLSGAPAGDLASGAGVPLAASYEVLVLRTAEGGNLTASQAALDAYAEARVLARFDGDTGTALLPVRADLRLDELMAGIVSSSEHPVTISAALAERTESVPAALREATEVAELVTRLGRPPGLYRMEDVLLEYQLARPGNALAQLAAKLDPLDERPELMDTLRVYVRNGHNRRQSALDLQVHRNTLDYRLRNIAALTGLDPSGAEGFRLLAAALTARALC
ncbi:PucR family transcriptional regulator [Actinocorallia populi]|uniref:PucR family transcriptional regulator n=1 Tax=Actinocorallia populi TaxID=2079200 RepID=UPI000D091E52|nr:helix-turn-helix domain-containing protein [Actinocorallia populi]